MHHLHVYKSSTRSYGCCLGAARDTCSEEGGEWNMWRIFKYIMKWRNARWVDACLLCSEFRVTRSGLIEISTSNHVNSRFKCKCGEIVLCIKSTLKATTLEWPVPIDLFDLSDAGRALANKSDRGFAVLQLKSRSQVQAHNLEHHRGPSRTQLSERNCVTLLIQQDGYFVLTDD